MYTPLDFVTVDFPNSNYIIYSNKDSDVGNYSFKMAMNTNNQQTASFSVMIEVKSSCLVAVFKSAAKAYFNIFYAVGELSQSYFFQTPLINDT